MTAQPLISLIDLNNQLDLDDVYTRVFMSKIYFDHTTLTEQWAFAVGYLQGFRLF